MTERPRREPRLGLAVFLIAFGFYLSTTGRYPLVGDALPLWEVAENIVTRGAVDIQTQFNVDKGSDGKIYSLHQFLPAVTHVPGAAVYTAVKKLAPRYAPLVFPLATRLGPSALGALTCLLFFALARRFVRLPAAAFTTFVVGLGTGVAVYARTPYTEALQIACFTGLALTLHDALEEPSAATARRVALALGLLLNSKLIYALAVPGILAVFIWRLRRDPKRLALMLAWAAFVLALTVLPILWYNLVRWGSPMKTGYGPSGGGTMWRGLWGLLFSPGKSVFLYNPPLALALMGLPLVVKRNARFVVALVVAVVPVVLYYAQFMYWDGDWAWGPRYLTFAIPAFCLGLALIVDDLLRRLRLFRATVLATAVAAGLWVQFLGCVYYWDHWLLITREATHQWLRFPVCDWPFPEVGGCWPDGKIFYAEHWIPALSPVAGHFWLLRHRPFDDSFTVAEEDAPWRWEGRNKIPTARISYAVAEVDWWFLDWKGAARAGRIVLGLLLVPLAAGLLLWWRRQRGSP